MKSKLKYRKGVIGLIIDKDSNFLLVQMMSYADNQWRSAGGGVRKGEGIRQALLRELQEELGTKKFKIIKKSKHKNKYDWPNSVIERLQREGKKVQKGQIQSVYLVQFTGKKEEIKPDPKEIKRIRWIKKDELSYHLIFPGQWDFIKKVVKEFEI